MALSATVKAIALALFLAGIAGATYGVQTSLGDTVRAQLVTVTAVRDTVNATAGHNVTFLVTVGNRDSASRDVSVSVTGAAQGASDGSTTILGASNQTLFVTVNVPSDAAPGDHTLDVHILGADGRVESSRNGILHLHVLAPATPGFGPGDAADVYYTGWLAATGRVFNTNDQSLIGLSFPKTDTYRFSDGFLQIQTVPRLNVVPGLAQGMRGMVPGERRTISFPPEQGYGPSTENEIFPRDDILQRNITVINDEQSVSRDTFDSYVAESGQGNASNFTVGSVFKLDQQGNKWPYRITNMTNETVQYKLSAQPGDVFTVYPFWPNASVVTAIDEAHVSFRTTPTTAVGDKLTLKAFWPSMSSMLSYNDTAVVVRNDPPVGYTFTQIVGQTPRTVTIKSVNETAIVGALPSQNPLAGKDLTFDVYLFDLTTAPARPSGT